MNVEVKKEDPSLKRKRVDNQSVTPKTTVVTSDKGGVKTTTTTSTAYNWGISPLPSNTNISTVDFNIGIDDIKIEKIDQPLVRRVISDAIDKFSNKDEKPSIFLTTTEDEKNGTKLVEYVVAINYDRETVFDTLKLAELQCIHFSLGLAPMKINYDIKTETQQLTISIPSLNNEMYCQSVSLLQHQVTPLLFYSDESEVGPNDDNKNESIFRAKKKVKYNPKSNNMI